MANNDLQNQLGLARIQAQTANMDAAAYNTQNATDPWRAQIQWGVGVWSTGAYNPGVVAQAPVTAQQSQVTNVNQQIREQNIASRSTWVRAPSVTNIGGIGISPKKNTNIAQTTWQIGTIPPVSGTPVSPTLNINQQQRLANIAKRQWVGGVTTPVTPTVPTTPTIPEASATGLQGAELEAYNQLTPQEQKTFQALATQGIKAQTDYLQKSKANQEYLKSQEELSQQVERNRDEAEDIQSRQQLEAAAKQVANLKQNIGYIGTGGQPGVSSAKLDAVGQQIALADKTYQNVVEIDRLSKANRALGQESHALQFTRQMTQLQDDLDSKVNKTIQWALNQYNAADLKWKLDTIPEIEAFQQQLYAQLDGDLSSIMDTNIEARKFLIERYDKLAESQKAQMAAQEKAKEEMKKRANTLNKEMSNALGYFVNENGDPLVDQTTGWRIVVPPEATTNYDASSGQMIIMTKNRDGSVWVEVKQVGTPKATYQKVGTDPNTGEDIYGFVTPQTQTVAPYTGSMGWNATGDLRGLASQFPWQAWAKNNNPAGITWNANFDNPKPGSTAQRLIDAWVQFSKGTPRPGNEGGNYVTFNTIEDGLKAQQIMMTQTYGNSTVGQMLASWVGTSEWPNYAKQVSWMAGVDPNVRVSSLTPEQLSTLQMAKIQKESPGLAKLLQWQQWTQEPFDDTKKSQYQAYLETGKLPTWMKAGLAKTSQFEQEATAWKESNSWFLTKDEKRDLAGIQNNIATDARRKDYLALSSKSKTLTGIQERLANWTATPQDKQQLVNDFAKILDPTSVVREGEYALAGKYSQSKIDSMKQEITNYFTTGGPLSNDAAKMLAEWVARRHLAIKQANDEAIDEGLANAKYLMWRDIPPEWVGAQYSDVNPKAKVQATQKKLGTTGWLKDFMSELTSLLQ